MYATRTHKNTEIQESFHDFGYTMVKNFIYPFFLYPINIRECRDERQMERLHEVKWKEKSFFAFNNLMCL